MLARIALLLCVAGALGRRHRQAVVELASQDEDRPSDAIGDAALRDRLDAVHRARGALSTSESEGVNGNARPGNSRDNGSLRRRMDCIVDRVNNCIEWCRLKPTDTRLRQNRDNEPCRYWRGDMKNKWMQSGICHNGRCG
ncbi:hypothetical protein MTO96_002156 [Rhipicephalus appendiculatus]